MFFAQEVDHDIGQEFTDLTFTSTFSVLTIGVAFVAVAGIIFAATLDAVTGALLVGGVIVTTARVALGLAYRRRRPRGPLTRIWLNRYAAGGYAFSALVASLSVWSTLNGHTDYEVLATTILFAYSTGMIVRVAVSPKMALGQLFIAFLPAAMVNLLAGTAMHLLLAALQLAFAISGSEMIKYLFETSLARARSQRELARMSQHDDLTGLPNRSHFRRRLEAAWQDWSGNGTQFSIYMLDLDGFKAINDQFGHAAGDDLLQQASARMQAALGVNDLLARLGGDEFALIHQGRESAEQRRNRADRIIRTVSSDPFVVAGQPVSIGISGGYAETAAGHLDADAVVICADHALYAAKSAGKNCARESETTPSKNEPAEVIAA